jgi:hypothetical protein
MTHTTYQTPPSETTPHDPAWAHLRCDVVDRMWRMNALHANHAWEHRHRDPIAAHALAYLYTDPDGSGVRLRAATRLFLDSPEASNLPRMLYGVCDVAVGLARTGRFDPRTDMADRTDPMSPAARFLGVGVSSLDTPAGKWTHIQQRARQPLDVPGRVYIQLTDGTRILCDRLGRDGAGELRIQSTACLEVTFGHPVRPYRWNRDLLTDADVATAQVWTQLDRLHAILWQADHAR